MGLGINKREFRRLSEFYIKTYGSILKKVSKDNFCAVSKFVRFLRFLKGGKRILDWTDSLLLLFTIVEKAFIFSLFSFVIWFCCCWLWWFSPSSIGEIDKILAVQSCCKNLKNNFFKLLICLCAKFTLWGGINTNFGFLKIFPSQKKFCAQTRIYFLIKIFLQDLLFLLMWL